MRTRTILPVFAAMVAVQLGGADRGLIAVLNSDGRPYIGWRLLKTDPSAVAFNVYRQSAGGKPVKVNRQPITASTNLVDATAPIGRSHSWFVRAVVNGRERPPSGTVTLSANSTPNQVFTIRL